jgi:hypothetical protein
MSYDFRRSKVMKASLVSLESFTRYFSKGYARPPGVESVLDPRKDEAVVFEDFLDAGLRIPSHPDLVDILHKYWV